MLAGAGLRVLGVEAGGWRPREQGNGWFELTLPAVRRGPGEPAAVPAQPAPMVNAIGGSNHRSARQSYRLDPWNLRTRSAAGAPLDADVTAADWPLAAADLTPYYERVEAAARVGPTAATAWTELMSGAATGLGWSPFMAPAATTPPLGRAELGPAIAAGRLRVLTGTVALRLLAGRDGAVAGVEALRGGHRLRLRGRRVLLAAHPFESVRLLLLSRSAAHPDGVGNSAGQVGADFATHSLLFAHGSFPGRDLGRAAGRPAQAAAVAELDAGGAGGADRGFHGGSLLQAAMGSGNTAAEVGTVWAQPEQLTRAGHRLDLDPARADPLGRPLLVATHDLAAEDHRRAEFLLERMEEWLRAAGAERTWRAPVEPVAVATHVYGGARMGTDPAAAVVDGHGAVHDAPGLLLAGGATFPTTGGRGPTATVEALAWRSTDRIAAELGG